jgi:hypothetical protein
MNNGTRLDPESMIRLDVALDILALSSARLQDMICSGAGEAAAIALATMRLARVRFLAARADSLEDRHWNRAVPTLAVF